MAATPGRQRPGTMLVMTPSHADDASVQDIPVLVPASGSCESETAGSPSLVRQVRRGLDDAASPLGGRRVVALCSGGVDSVVLVDVLASLPRGARPRSLVVLFLDHGLRSDVSAERAAARAVAARHHIAFMEFGASPSDVAAWGDGSPQHDARAWRYEAAAGIAREQGADAVVTGHNADDQLETMLLALVSSGGLGQLAGMQVRRVLAHAGSDGCVETRSVELIRPLLASSRAAIVRHAREHDLAWAEDPSNGSLRYRRNELRHTVVPRLVEIHPGAGRNLERVRRGLAEQATLSDRLLDGLLCLVSRRGDDRGGAALDASQLARLDDGVQRAVLAEWLRRQGLGRGLGERVLRQVQGLIPDGSEDGLVHVRDACVRRDGYLLTFRPVSGAGRSNAETVGSS